MNKIPATFLVWLCFSSACFAATSDYMEMEADSDNNGLSALYGPSSPGVKYDYALWLTFQGQGLTGLSAQAPLINDTGFYYVLGATFGGNFSKYVGVQSSISFVPPVDKKKSTEIFLDALLIFQKDVRVFSSGFRPYIGVGIAMEYSFNPNDINYVGYGLATEAGLRYFYGHFLIGVNANVNLYWTAVNGRNLGDDFSSTHSNIRFGLSVGYIF